MVDEAALDTARRKLAELARLPDDEFWRAYARIEDAALLSTEPEDQGTIMEALNTCLIQLGRVPGPIVEPQPPERRRPGIGLA